MPMEHLDASSMTVKPIPQPIVHWPSVDVCSEGGDETQGQALSTLRFTRRFQREPVNDTASSTRRFLPEMCPINVSLSRCGKLIGLGKANVIVTGEEKGDSSIVVPISSTIKEVGVSSPMRKSSTKDHIPMIRIKGDDVQFGLKDDSFLRVLVSIADAQDDTDNAQEDVHLHSVSEDFMNDEYKSCDLVDYEVNNVTYSQESYESFLGFLNGAVDADVIGKQDSTLSPLSCESDDVAYCGEEGNVNDDAPKLPLEENLVGERYNEGIDKLRMRPFQPELCPNNQHNSPPLLKEVCEKLDFDIAEMWLRVDASKHRLVHYHVSDVLDQSVRRQVMNVYQGVAAQRMKHRLSAAMCKLTKETKNVFKITMQSPSGAQALQSGLVSGISVALAVPICHEGVNMNILTFCVNRASMESQLDGSLEGKGKEIEEIAHAMTRRSK